MKNEVNMNDEQQDALEQLAQLREQVQADPQNIELLFQLSQAAVKQDLFEDALQACNHIIDLQPDNHRAYFERGLVYENYPRTEEDREKYAGGKVSGNAQMAEAAFKYLEKRNEPINLHYLEGSDVPVEAFIEHSIRVRKCVGQLREKGHCDEAIRDYSEAIRLAPDNIEYHEKRIEYVNKDLESCESFLIDDYFLSAGASTGFRRPKPIRFGLIWLCLFTFFSSRIAVLRFVTI